MTPAETAAIITRLDNMQNDVSEIKTHVSQTNGRVMKLELWQARILGAIGILSLIGTPVALSYLNG
jgi:hypothetical protein